MSAPTPMPAAPRGVGWVAVQTMLLVALLVTGPSWPANWHSLGGVVLGAVLFVLAGAIGVTGVVQLGDNRTPYPRPLPGSALVVQGVYRWVRHPLYVSVMLGAFGWGLLWQSGVAMGVATVVVGFFDLKARREERWLREAFPDYADYARRVRRFVPGVY